MVRLIVEIASRGRRPKSCPITILRGIKLIDESARELGERETFEAAVASQRKKFREDNHYALVTVNCDLGDWRLVRTTLAQQRR